MATQVFISCDTELSALLYQRGASGHANFDASITGRTTRGDFGIGWQMDRLEEHGLKGVFFVDPMPALVHGRQIVADIVGLILSRGHEVQLHIHTEWLDFATTNPFAPLNGHSIADFPPDAQTDILALARDSGSFGIPASTPSTLGRNAASLSRVKRSKPPRIAA